MATAFKNLLVTGLGTTPTTVLTTSASARTTAIGLSLANKTPNIVIVSVQLQDTVASTSAYYAYNLIIPPNNSARVINGGEKLILGASTNVVVTCNTDAGIDLVMSYVEIS
jgi:hypothetical protein